jgi:predicted membrane channel-forming protein YqfA (hemolysin III family)
MFLGGFAIAIFVGTMAAHQHSWVGVAWAAALGLCLVLFGLSYAWKQTRALPALYLQLAITFGWLVIIARQRWLEKVQVRPESLILAFWLTSLSILYLIGYYKSRKGQQDVFCFWWWVGPRQWR